MSKNITRIEEAKLKGTLYFDENVFLFGSYGRLIPWPDRSKADDSVLLPDCQFKSGRT